MRKALLLAAVSIALAACSYKPGPEAIETRKKLNDLGKAVMKYKTDIGKYPQTLADLITKPQPQAPEAKKWKAPFLNPPEVPRDGWGNDFVYRPVGSNGAPFDLISLGEDGKPGGKNDSQDLAYDKRSLGPEPKK